MSDLKLRPFEASDYPAVVAVYNALNPKSPITVAEAQDFDKRFEADLFGDSVAELNGEVVAELRVVRSQMGKNALKLELNLHPSYSNTARQRQLLEMGVAEAVEHRPSALFVTVRENWPGWLELLEAEGFRELERQWPSYLDLTSFDPAPFESAFAKAEAADVHFGTLAELPDTLETQRQVYEAVAHVLLPGVPFAEPLEIWDFETWQTRAWNNPNLLREGYFLAWHGDTIIGVSQLYKTSEPDKLSTGLTAVREAYRRKGVAMSLKLKAIAFAYSYGAAQITTSNHSINRPMLSINEALGFVKAPAWVTLKKELS